VRVRRDYTIAMAPRHAMAISRTAMTRPGRCCAHLHDPPFPSSMIAIRLSRDCSGLRAAASVQGIVASPLLKATAPPTRGFSEQGNTMARTIRITNARAFAQTPALTGTFRRAASVSRAPILAVAVGLVFVYPLCAGRVYTAGQAQDDRQQMKGLDEQVQEVKSDVLDIAQELNRLEEKLLYPSGTQVAVFVTLPQGEPMRLDAVRLQIDGQLVAHHLYSAKELDALRKGGVQRIYVGNVATGEHRLDVLVDGALEGGADFSRTEHFTFRKEVKPRLLGLTLAGPASGKPSIALGEW
jgi:hypothetical protein